MAWTAKIESKSFEKGVLQVGVVYTSGTDTFSESYQIYSNVDLDNRIASRLSQLEELENISIDIGEYSPLVTSTNAKQERLGELREVKELVDLGVLDENDKKVIDAMQAVKDVI